MSKLKPTYFYETLEQIPFDLLKKENIKGIIIDVDNTLVDMTSVLSTKRYEWIKNAKKQGFLICILSNTLHESKVRKMMDKLGINGMYFAMKPFLRGFKTALSILGLEKQEVIMIGDQLFTDIYGANRFGIKSILLDPISKLEGPFTKIKRPIEKIYIKKLKIRKDE